MAIKTLAELKWEIENNLPDNRTRQITPEILRNLENNIADTLFYYSRQIIQTPIYDFYSPSVSGYTFIEEDLSGIKIDLLEFDEGDRATMKFVTPFDVTGFLFNIFVSTSIIEEYSFGITIVDALGVEVFSNIFALQNTSVNEIEKHTLTVSATFSKDTLYIMNIVAGSQTGKSKLANGFISF